MSNIDKQWLQQKIADMEEHRDLFPGDLDDDHGSVLAALRIALASLEAEPVAYVMADDLKDSSIISTPAYRDLGEAMERTVGDVVALFTAPPAPVSVPAAYEHTEDFSEYHEGWNACRAAMLQGAENAETPTTMQTAPALDSSPKIAESTSGNSPVIPDEVLSAVRKVACIREDFDDFDGDRRGIGDCLDEAGQELIVTINKYASVLAAAPQRDA